METSLGEVDTPMSNSYTPELDVAEALWFDDVTFYQEELIRVLRWATEIGRVDILLKVPFLSQYSTSPRKGHFEWLLHILAFLRTRPKSMLYLSPQLPLMDFGAIQTNKTDFCGIYCDAEEPMSNAQATGTKPDCDNVCLCVTWST